MDGQIHCLLVGSFSQRDGDGFIYSFFQNNRSRHRLTCPAIGRLQRYNHLHISKIAHPLGYIRYRSPESGDGHLSPCFINRSCFFCITFLIQGYVSLIGSLWKLVIISGDLECFFPVGTFFSSGRNLAFKRQLQLHLLGNSDTAAFHAISRKMH